MRRFLAFALFAALLAPLAQAQPKPGEHPMLNANNAKLAGTAADLPSPCTGVAFVEGKGLLVASDEAGQLHVWKREEGKDWLKEKPRTIKAHGRPITALCAAGELVASSSTDGKVHVWKLPEEKPAATLELKAAVRALAFSPDGKWLAVAGDDGKVALAEPLTKKVVRTLDGPRDWLTAVAFSPDGKLVAAGGHDGKLWLWEADSGKKRFDVLAQVPPAPKAPPPDDNVVGGIAFAPDGKSLWLGGSNGNLYTFDTASGKLVRTMAPAHTSAVTGIWWHPANYVVVSVSKDRNVQLWASSGGKLKALPGHEAWAEGVAALAKGTEVATAGADRTVRLWSLGAVMPPKKK